MAVIGLNPTVNEQRHVSYQRWAGLAQAAGALIAWIVFLWVTSLASSSIHNPLVCLRKHIVSFTCLGLNVLPRLQRVAFVGGEREDK